MLRNSLPEVLVDGQLLAAGLALHLAIQHFLGYRRARSAACLWMAVWSVTTAVTADLAGRLHNPPGIVSRAVRSTGVSQP